ncbi:MAG TPA: hypothetical protein VFU02_17200 [Polyangiaceae bacterium]|nr:hypothetical protein [Polyangiaceae bacterium]
MTKKDYIRAAEIIRESGAKGKVLETLISSHVALFKSENPRFDESRFRAACDPKRPMIQARHNTKPRPARTGFDT